MAGHVNQFIDAYFSKMGDIESFMTYENFGDEIDASVFFKKGDFDEKWTYCKNYLKGKDKKMDVKLSYKKYLTPFGGIHRELHIEMHIPNARGGFYYTMCTPPMDKYRKCSNTLTGEGIEYYFPSIAGFSKRLGIPVSVEGVVGGIEITFKRYGDQYPTITIAIRNAEKLSDDPFSRGRWHSFD